MTPNRTGKSNTIADSLSQRPDYRDSVEENTPVQVFPANAETQASFTSELEMLLLKNSVEHTTKPDVLNDTWTRDHTELWSKGHIAWVPADVQEAMLNHEYTIPTAGHPGVRKMKSVLLKSYWWPTMEEDAE